MLAAEDGQAAWELLDQHADEVDVVATDSKCPDGRAGPDPADSRGRALCHAADHCVSSLAGEEEIARGMEAGVDEYQVKLNKDELQQSIRRAIGRAKEPVALA